MRIIIEYIFLKEHECIKNLINLLVPYGELKHSGRAINSAPFCLAFRMDSTAFAIFLVLSGPTANCMKATRRPEYY